VDPLVSVCWLLGVVLFFLVQFESVLGLFRSFRPDKALLKDERSIVMDS
jgi:hypothetical protein